MSDDDAQGAFDAIALATLVADANESGQSWGEALVFAQDNIATGAVAGVLLGNAHLLVKTLEAMASLINGYPDGAVEVANYHRPASAQTLLRHLGQDASRPEGED